MPEAAKSLGYMLISVKPGMVFGSLSSISPSLRRTKKSTLVRPEQPNDLKALTAAALTASSFSSGRRAGICSSLSPARY